MKLTIILLVGLVLLGIEPATAGAQQARVSVVDSANARLRTTPKRKSAATERSAADSKTNATKFVRSVATPPVNPLANAAHTSDSLRPPPPATKRAPKPKKGT